MKFLREMKPHKNQVSGQSLVEFALVLPILLLLIVSIIDFGILFYTQVMVLNAAWEGARAGAMINDPSTGDQEIVGAIHGAGSGLDTSQMVIDIDPNQNENPRNQAFPAPRGEPLTVTIQYPIELTIPTITLTITGKAVTRMEYQNP